jgi:transcriptional regulator with XRE-family HTH domain
MDKRTLAATFRARLEQLIEGHPGGLGRFAEETGIDRSALAQFLDPDRLRLPRAETLRRIAEAKGTSADWLLGLANVSEGGQAVASSVEIEVAVDETGNSPLALWQREAAGGKIRYVPSALPDLFRLPDFSYEAVEPGRAEARAESAAEMRETAQLRDTDVEVCMPRQVLEALAAGQGLWQGIPAEARQRQLLHMAELSEALYPTVRLHLYDGQATFSAPLTVFGLKRAAIYLGRSYLVVTSTVQVRQLARHFDELVRAAAVAPNTVHEALFALGAEVG